MDKFIHIKVLNMDLDGTISLRDFYFNPSKVSSLMMIHEVKMTFVDCKYKDVVYQSKLVVDGIEYMSDSDVWHIMCQINDDDDHLDDDEHLDDRPIL